MGNIILTQSRKAVHPYYAADIGVHLYTAEELCYFIYNNLMLINKDFIDDRLLEFIKELGFPDLYQKLFKWKDDMNIRDLLVVILQDVHYYSLQEIESFREEVNRISKEGYEKILNEKADYMLEIGRCYDAIRMYEKLLETPGEYIKRQKTLAQVYLAKGKAAARLFNYENAIADFIKSYTLTGAELPLKYAFMAGLIKGALTPEGKISKTGVIENSELKKEFEMLIEELGEEKIRAWLDEYHETVKKAGEEGKALETSKLLAADERKRRSGFMELIAKWKADYKRCES